MYKVEKKREENIRKGIGRMKMIKVQNVCVCKFDETYIL